MPLSPLYISLKVAFVATFFTMLFGILAANRVVKLKRFKGVIDGIFTLPMVLPPTVVGFFLLLIFGNNGYFGKYLAQIGMSVVFTWQGATIAAAVVSFPLVYRTSRGAFEQMDQNLVYAARTLGMPEWKIFLLIIMPSCWPGVAAGTILAFARALGEFGATTMLAGNIPGRTQTMSLAVYSAVQSNNREKAFYWVIIIMGISFITMLLMNYWTGYQERSKRKRA
ncbi:MAG: molybdate ABC transporter permease subunit [Clostridia bacterium]|nr:molybdate ABC transporter permease subunit [Clostridia bacterium]MDD4798982.1 molybdate ABC transporter permease subunit [Clostridia bacterium]